MYIHTGILPALAVVTMVATAQPEQAAEPAAALERMMERLTADEVMSRSAGWTPVATRRRVSAIREHLELVKQGKETLKDYAWLPEILHLYYDKDKKQPPLETLQQLIAAGADVNARDDRGRTALFYHCGSAEAAKLLLEAGADVNAVARGNRTPIYTALGKNDLPVLELMIAAGADLNVRDDTGATPLYENMCCGANEVSSRLIAAGADVNIRTRTGKSAVDIALESNNSDIMMEMVKVGAKLDTSEHSPLFVACFYGQTDAVQKLIDEGADVGAPFKDGSTPLLLAARTGNVELCRLLLDAGADAAPERGCALHSSAEENRPKACETLIAAGVDVEMRDNDDLTPLAIAVQSGSAEAVDALLAAGADMNALCNAKPIVFITVSRCSDDRLPMLRKLIAAGVDLKKTARGTGMTIMHEAAANNEPEACDLLLAAGVDVNSLDALGCTPLTHAIGRGNEEVCKKLLAAGADAYAGKYGGFKAFGSSYFNGDAEKMINLLLEHGVKPGRDVREETAFFVFLARDRKGALCRRLVREGLQPEGWSPLSLAALLGDSEEVQRLLAAGGDANEAHCAQHLLTIAAYMGNTEVCRLLIAAGALLEPEAENYTWTPLLAAVESDHPEIVKLLLEAGAKPELPERTGTNVLYRAALRGDVELCRMLLAAGADANAPSPGAGDKTPLHAAMETKAALALSRLFIENGASPNMQDHRGNTPLHTALRAGSNLRFSSPLCKLLIDAGAKTDIKNRDGKTAVDMEAESKHTYHYSMSEPATLPLFK